MSRVFLDYDRAWRVAGALFDLSGLRLRFLHPRSAGQKLRSQRFPGGMGAVATPEPAGYSGPKLKALRTWLKTQNTTVMLVIVGGRVLFEYDLHRALRSVRTRAVRVRKSRISL